MPTVHPSSIRVPTAPRIVRRRIACAAVAVAAAASFVPAVAAAAPVGQSISTCASAGRSGHLVASGDTWFDIAKGAGVSMRALFEANDASSDVVLHPGDIVCLPVGATVASSCQPSNAPTYTVVSGDTWSGIATRAGVSMSAVLSANSAVAERVIHPGDALCLPVGASIATDSAAAATAGSATTPTANASSLAALPMQGPCWFSDDWGDPRGGGRRHQGTDLFAAPQSYVYAVVDGTLTRRAWDQPGLRSGNAWWLTSADGSGTYYFYAHLADFAPELSVGSRVEAGQIIGFMGNTGNSAFPHLHFEIHPNGGGAVNPYPILRQTGGCNSDEPYRQPGGWIPD